MKNLLISLVSVLPCIASANYYCSGKVSHLGSSDTLNMSNGFGVHRLCSFEESKCNAWLSLLMAAKMSDRKVIVYYQSASSQGGEQNNGLCQDIGNWVNPSDPVYYVQIQ